VLVDETKCVGCGYCVMACPYNAPKVSRELGYSVKCNGCEERLNQGLQPICVMSCPLRALDFGPIDELRKKYGDTAEIHPMPSASYTHPNITIKPSPAALDPAASKAHVANPKEVQ